MVTLELFDNLVLEVLIHCRQFYCFYILSVTNTTEILVQHDHDL